MTDKPLYSKHTIEQTTFIRWNQIAFVLLFTGIFVLGANLLVAHQINNYGEFEATRNSTFAEWYKLMNQQDSFEVLILGDSSAWFGIDENLLESSLNLNTIATPSTANWGLNSDVWMLRAFLETYERSPEYIVIIHTPQIYTTSIDPTLLATMQTSQGFKYTYDFQQTQYSYSEQIELYFRRYLPIYFQRDTAKAYITSPTFSPQFTLKATSQSYNKWLDVKLTEEEVFTNASSQMVKYGYPDGLFISDQSNYAMQQLSQLSEEYDIQIYLVTAPLYIGVQDDPIFKEYFEDYKRVSKNWAVSSNHITFIDQTVFLDASYMRDLHHVNRDGQHIYTLALVDILKEAFESE